MAGHRGSNALTSLDDLSELTSVEWELIVHDTSALTSLDGLASLTSVGTAWPDDFLSVRDNVQLTDCASNFEATGETAWIGQGLAVLGSQRDFTNDKRSWATYIDDVPNPLCPDLKDLSERHSLGKPRRGGVFLVLAAVSMARLPGLTFGLDPPSITRP